MKYSDWQLDRLRDCLRAYHRYERSHEGEYFTWKDVSEAIDEYAGVRVPPERLRQFVEGVNTKDGGRKFPVPQDKSVEGIAKFVTVEELCLISEEELTEFMPNKQAAMRLLEYLDQDLDQERIVPADKIQGSYFSIETNETEQQIVRHGLTLQRPSGDGLMQVVETEEIIDSSTSVNLGAMEPPNSRLRHGGWAILTPEDNLLIFLKSELHGRNRYYITVATDLVHWEDRPMTRLVLLRHDFPIELQSELRMSHKISNVAQSAVAENILVFQRSGTQEQEDTSSEHA